jgi:rod shape-determining protein MreC
VALLTGKESSFDVRVGDGGIDGLARGQGNFNLNLDLVPKDKDISSGSAVVTSSLGGIFPKDLVVGNIGSVQKNDAQMFQKAQIIPAFKIQDTDSVFIVMGVNAPTDALPAPKTSPTK